jgi:secretion/DNA translocation related TadE-like protein
LTQPALAWRLRAERGSVTVVAAAVMALVAVLTMGAADVGKALVARERAQAAADAAALAAAQELVLPTGRTPAALAAEYAARNGATLAGCVCATGASEAIVEVHAGVGTLLLVPGDHEAVAVARATVGVADP